MSADEQRGHIRWVAKDVSKCVERRPVHAIDVVQDYHGHPWTTRRGFNESPPERSRHRVTPLHGRTQVTSRTTSEYVAQTTNHFICCARIFLRVNLSGPESGQGSNRFADSEMRNSRTVRVRADENHLVALGADDL